MPKHMTLELEMNTEDFADLVPPCAAESGVSSSDKGKGAANPAIAEDGIIIPHPGIFGGDDLSELMDGMAQ